MLYEEQEHTEYNEQNKQEGGKDRIKRINGLYIETK
jgi:hypothetical protein